MATYTYKNISDLPQLLIGHGTIEPGKTFKTDEEVNNPNFEKVTESKSKTQPKGTK